MSFEGKRRKGEKDESENENESEKNAILRAYKILTAVTKCKEFSNDFVHVCDKTSCHPSTESKLKREGRLSKTVDPFGDKKPRSDVRNRTYACDYGYLHVCKDAVPIRWLEEKGVKFSKCSIASTTGTGEVYCKISGQCLGYKPAIPFLPGMSDGKNGYGESDNQNVELSHYRRYETTTDSPKKRSSLQSFGFGAHDVDRLDKDPKNEFWQRNQLQPQPQPQPQSEPKLGSQSQRIFDGHIKGGKNRTRETKFDSEIEINIPNAGRKLKKNESIRSSFGSGAGSTSASNAVVSSVVRGDRSVTKKHRQKRFKPTGNKMPELMHQRLSKKIDKKEKRSNHETGKKRKRIDDDEREQEEEEDLKGTEDDSKRKRHKKSEVEAEVKLPYVFLYYEERKKADALAIANAEQIKNEATENDDCGDGDGDENDSSGNQRSLMLQRRRRIRKGPPRMDLEEEHLRSVARELITKLFYSEKRTEIHKVSTIVPRDKGERAVKMKWTTAVKECKKNKEPTRGRSSSSSSFSSRNKKTHHANADSNDDSNSNLPVTTGYNSMMGFTTYVNTVMKHTKIKKTPKLPMNENFISYFTEHALLQWKILQNSSTGSKVIKRPYANPGRKGRPPKSKIKTTARSGGFGRNEEDNGHDVYDECRYDNEREEEEEEEKEILGRKDATAKSLDFTDDRPPDEKKKRQKKSSQGTLTFLGLCLAMLMTFMRVDTKKEGGKVLIPFCEYVSANVPQIKDLESYDPRYQCSLITKSTGLIKTIYKEMFDNGTITKEIIDAVDKIKMRN